MYTTVETVQRIKNLAREKSIKTTEILSACELSKNALSSMSGRGSWIQANSLAKIADYLECSVDYLLGRTEEPQLCTNNSVKTGNINGNNSGNFTIGTSTPEKEKDSIKQEFLFAFDNLDFVEKMEIMNAVLEKTKMKGNK